MDEQASFEPQAVLGGRRAGRNRLLVAVPVIAFAGIAWAGLSGSRSGADSTAEQVATTAPALATAHVGEPPLSAARATGPAYPSRLLGFAVHRLDDVQPAQFGEHDVTAIAGWYVATAITDCPPLAAIHRAASPAEISGDTDSWAFCDRSGVLYASRPDLEPRLPTNNLEDNRSKGAGLPVVPAELMIGIRVPPQLELIGTTATPVVVLGRFVDSNAGCGSPAVCRRILAIDHVGWALGSD